MAAKKDLERYLDNWNDERSSAAIYHLMAELQKDERLAKIYKRMAAVEIHHAERWEKLMREGGAVVPEFKLPGRTRVVMWMARRFGPQFVLPNMATLERQGSSGYRNQPEAQDFAADESSHARILTQIAGTGRGGMEGAALAQLEGRHRSAGGNALRAAVLGANDGLVSNLSLVMGVAGAALASRQIMITGLAGLLAGACSMALGEWLSVQSSRELYENQLKIEAEEIAIAPQEEAEELALIYEARGLKPEQARTLAKQILTNQGNALETMAREELGIDPGELGGSAWEAAITSFLLFSVGAIVPVFPFFFATGMTAMIISIVVSMLALFLVGAATALFTGKGALFSGFRMVIFGMLAAAVTYGIGALIGANLGG